MSESDKISVEASGKGGKITIEGSGSGRLSAQLGDLISPFSETLGALGDHLKVWRESSLLAALSKAREKITEQQIAIEPVAPKTLTYWVEKASLEDNDALAEKWANLLISSMGDFDSTSIWSANVLSELGKPEAELMEELIKRYHWSKGVRQQTAYHLFERYDFGTAESIESIMKEIDFFWPRFLEIDDLGWGIKHSFADGIDHFLGEEFRDYQETFVEKIELKPVDEHSTFSANIEGGLTVYFLKDEISSIEYLITKGLLARSSRSRIRGDGKASVTGIHLTMTGIIFMRQIASEAMESTGSSYSPNVTLTNKQKEKCKRLYADFEKSTNQVLHEVNDTIGVQLNERDLAYYFGPRSRAQEFAESD